MKIGNAPDDRVKAMSTLSSGITISSGRGPGRGGCALLAMRIGWKLLVKSEAACDFLINAKDSDEKESIIIENATMAICIIVCILIPLVNIYKR